MEKKYYFRGLGLGIIVTALIMGIALSRGEKREMTDAEIIARAKELGMTENTRLVEPSETAEDQEETEPSAGNETAEEPVKKDVAVAQPKDEVGEPAKDGQESSDVEPAEQTPGGQQEKPAAQEDASSSLTTQNKQPSTDTNEMTKQDEDTGHEKTTPVEESPEDTSAQQTASAVSITIVSGDGSYTVAKKLEEAGVVFSASDYDNYLCQHGYDKRLRTGTFQIPAGASNEQIAKIVTNQP